MNLNVNNWEWISVKESIPDYALHVFFTDGKELFFGNLMYMPTSREWSHNGWIIPDVTHSSNL